MKLHPPFLTPLQLGFDCVVSLFPSPRLLTNNSVCTEELWSSPPGPPTWTQCDKELVFKDQSITGDVIIEMPTLERSCVANYPPQMVYISNNDVNNLSHDSDVQLVQAAVE